MCCLSCPLFLSTKCEFVLFSWATAEIRIAKWMSGTMEKEDEGNTSEERKIELYHSAEG